MDFNFKFLVRNRNSLFGHNFVANESSEISSLFKFFLDPRDREIKHLDYYVIGNVLGEINRSFEGIRLGIDLFDIFLFRDMAKLMQSNSKLIITSCLLLEEIEKLFSEEKYRITDLFDEVLELDLKISQESFRLIKSTYEYDSQLWEAR